jgi:hypothetical protein
MGVSNVPSLLEIFNSSPFTKNVVAFNARGHSTSRMQIRNLKVDESCGDTITSKLAAISTEATIIIKNVKFVETTALKFYTNFNIRDTTNSVDHQNSRINLIHE